MEHHLGRVDAADLRDERQEAVPERERIAGMEPAVGELVRALEREVVEREELLDAREVEEPVAADLPATRQRRIPNPAPEERREPPAANAVHPRPPPDRERERHQTGGEHQHEREGQRGRDEEGQGHRAENQESAQATPADTRVTPSARATTNPGTSTTPVASASRRNSQASLTAKPFGLHQGSPRR